MAWAFFLGLVLAPQSGLPSWGSEEGKRDRLTPFGQLYKRNPKLYLRMATEIGGGADTEEALARALEALALCQNEDGSWGPTTENPRIELTSLALLAYLGAGWNLWDQETLPMNTNRCGSGAPATGPAPPYHRVLRRGVSYLLGRQNADGFIGDRGIAHSLRNHAVGARALSEAYSWSAMAILRDPAERAIKALAFVAASLPKEDPEAMAWGALALRSATLADLPFDREEWNHFVPDWTAPSAGIPLKAAVDLLMVRQLQRAGKLTEKLRMSQWPMNLTSENPREWYWGTLAMVWFGPDGSGWKKWNRRLKSELLPMKEGGAESLAFGALTLEAYYPDNVLKK